MLKPISHTETILMDSYKSMRSEAHHAIRAVDRNAGAYCIPRPSESAKRLWVEHQLTKVGCKYGD